MGFCNDNWYTPVWYEDELFSVSQPAKAQCDDESGGTISNAVLEFGITMQLVLLYFRFCVKINS